MRFGSRSHDSEPDKSGGGKTAERDRLVRTLRDLADRIHQAPFGQITATVPVLAMAVEPLVRMVEQAIGRSNSVSRSESASR